MNKRLFYSIFLVLLGGLLMEGTFAEYLTNGDFNLFADEYLRNITGYPVFYTGDFNFPTSWEADVSDFQNYAMECHDSLNGSWIECFGSNSEARSGSSLGYVFTPDWYINSPYDYGGTVGYASIYQNIGFSSDVIFTVEGYYKLKSMYNSSYVNGTDYTNSTFMSNTLSFTGISTIMEIEFNDTATDLSGSNGWKYFKVKYDGGVCSIENGDVVVNTCNTGSTTAVKIKSVYDFGNANSSNLVYVNYTKFLIDDVEVKTLTGGFTGVGDYYSTYLQSLDSYSSSYEICGIRPNSVNTKIYSGRIMDTMKTRFLNISFDNIYVNCIGGTGYPAQTYIEKIEYKDEQGNWKTQLDGSMTDFLVYNPFCRTPYSCTYGSSGGNYYGQLPILKRSSVQGYMDFYFGLIVPINAREINITFHDMITSSGGTNHYTSTMNFTLSDIIQNSGSPIDTSLCNQSQPAFFPSITETVVQETGSKNITMFELHLPFWYNKAYSKVIYWENNTLQIHSYNTGTIPAESYANYTYDSSGWGIKTDDFLDIYTSGYSYFGDSYRTTSIYLFDTEPSVCPDYCLNGNYYDGTDVGGGNCEYVQTSCASICVPFVLNFTYEYGTSTFSYNASHVNLVNYTYVLTNMDNGLIEQNGTIIYDAKTFENLAVGTNYEFYINGTHYYSCVVNLANLVTFRTLDVEEVPDMYADIVADLGETVSGFFSAITGFMFASFGWNETIGKAFMWIVLAIGISVWLGKKFDERSQQGSMMGIAIAMIVLGMVVGWLPVVIGIILGVLVTAVLVMALKRMVD